MPIKLRDKKATQKCPQHKLHWKSENTEMQFDDWAQDADIPQPRYAPAKTPPRDRFPEEKPQHFFQRKSKWESGKQRHWTRQRSAMGVLTASGWLSGVVVKSRTSDSDVTSSSPTRTITLDAVWDLLINCYWPYRARHWHWRPKPLVLAPMLSGTLSHLTVDPVNCSRYCCPYVKDGTVWHCLLHVGPAISRLWFACDTRRYESVLTHWLIGLLLSNNLEEVIYTRGAQANSAFHPSGVGK